MVHQVYIYNEYNCFSVEALSENKFFLFHNKTKQKQINKLEK